MISSKFLPLVATVFLGDPALILWLTAVHPPYLKFPHWYLTALESQHGYTPSLAPYINLGGLGWLLQWFTSAPMNFLSQQVHLNSYRRANIFQKMSLHGICF
jgi:hypothetical protein